MLEPRSLGRMIHENLRGMGWFEQPTDVDIRVGGLTSCETVQYHDDWSLLAQVRLCRGRCKI